MVECNLAKVDVAGSSPVSRLKAPKGLFFYTCHSVPGMAVGFDGCPSLRAERFCDRLGRFARVAQLDRALASEAKGRGFDSHLAHSSFFYGFGRDKAIFMDDVFFRDLIDHAMRSGADDACVDEDRIIEDIDQLDHGSISQERRVSASTTLYVRLGTACIRVCLQDMPSATLAFAKKKVDEAIGAAHLVDAWTMSPGTHALPTLMEDDTYRYLDPFDDDPDAVQKKRKAFEAFLNSSSSQRAPILLREFSEISTSGGDLALLSRQTITRRIQRRITATEMTTAHSGFTRLERTIFHYGSGQTSTLTLPDYQQIGYGIDPDAPESAEVMRAAPLATHYAMSSASSSHLSENAPAIVLGAWATNVILHETIHQSPYYLGQSEAIAIDRNRGILQCSTPHGSCSAYAIHPTGETVLTLSQLLPDIPDGTLYVDAPTFVTRYSDKTIDVTFSIVRTISNHKLDQAFKPATLKFVPHMFWKSIRTAFGPLCRISMRCQTGEPTFQSPGLWLDAPSQLIL